MMKKTIISPDMERVERIPPGQNRRRDFPVLHYGDAPKIKLSSWRFRIFGEVEREQIIPWEEFMLLPSVRVKSDIHCVTGWSRLDNEWEGVSARAIVDSAEIKKNVAFVIVHAENGFTANLPISDFIADDVLFAYKHDGEFLSVEHGYPLRLVAPRLYFWKSAKWVTGVEFSVVDKPGFWESYGYHNHGDPWEEERYSEERI